MQNSAISLELCLDDSVQLYCFVQDLQNGFSTNLLKDVSLFTVRNAKIDELR